MDAKRGVPTIPLFIWGCHQSEIPRMMWDFYLGQKIFRPTIAQIPNSRPLWARVGLSTATMKQVDLHRRDATLGVHKC